MKTSKPSKSNSRSAKQHAAKVGAEMDALVSHLRDDIHKFSEPKAQALFETAAEVLIGLRAAFEHYERAAEPAMTESAHSP